jgi:hypothetical protein
VLVWRKGVHVMKPFAISMALLALLAGCRTPPTSWNFFAPYGATRVPPPSTGAYTRPDTYYQPSTVQPGAPANQRTELSKSGDSALASDTQGSRTTPASPIGAFVSRDVRQASDDRVFRSADGTKVKLASSSRAVASEAPIRIVESEKSESSGRLELKGMPINDATRPAGEIAASAEPGPFQPPNDATDMSQLPKPTMSQRSATGNSATLEPPSATSSSTKGDRSSSEPSASWHGRTDTTNTLGVAGR